MKEYYQKAAEGLEVREDLDGIKRLYWTNSRRRGFKGKRAGTYRAGHFQISITIRGHKQRLKEVDVINFMFDGTIPAKKKPKHYFKYGNSFQVIIRGNYIGCSKTAQGAKEIVKEYFRTLQVKV